MRFALGVLGSLLASCGASPPAPVEQTPPQPCVPANSTSELFELGSGCGSDLDEAFPCARYVGSEWRVSGVAHERFDGQGVDLRFVAHPPDVAAATTFLEACEADLSALEYETEREPVHGCCPGDPLDRLVATSDIDEVIAMYIRPHSTLRVGWRMMVDVPEDGLLDEQLRRATGAGESSVDEAD